jgi:hypothetical protein
VAALAHDDAMHEAGDAQRRLEEYDNQVLPLPLLRKVINQRFRVLEERMRVVERNQIDRETLEQVLYAIQENFLLAQQKLGGKELPQNQPHLPPNTSEGSQKQDYHNLGDHRTTNGVLPASSTTEFSLTSSQESTTAASSPMMSAQEADTSSLSTITEVPTAHSSSTAAAATAAAAHHFARYA